MVGEMLGSGVWAARGGAQGTARVQGHRSLFSASDPIPQAWSRPHPAPPRPALDRHLPHWPHLRTAPPWGRNVSGPCGSWLFPREQARPYTFPSSPRGPSSHHGFSHPHCPLCPAVALPDPHRLQKCTCHPPAELSQVLCQSPSPWRRCVLATSRAKRASARLVSSGLRSCS